MSVGPNDDDESTIDSDLPPPPRPRAPLLPTKPVVHPQAAVTTRPIPRSQAPDAFDDDGDFEGDDPPTTAEPVRDDHHPQIVPRSPSIPTRPVPKLQAHDSGDSGDFDDDANPTMWDPDVPTGAVASASPRAGFDPYDRIDDNRRTTDLSGAAKRATQASDPRSRDIMPTAPIRKPAMDAVGTAPKSAGPLASGSSPPPRREGPRIPPGPTGPMLRPPPDAPPALSPPPSAPRSQRASGPQSALAPTPPPSFVQDRRAAMTGQQPVELPRTIQDPPYDGASPPAPLRAFGPPSSQAQPTVLQRPAQNFDPHGRIDDSSRTNRWEGRPDDQNAFATPYAPTHESHPPPAPQPMQAISHKTPDNGMRPNAEHRAVPKVQIRSMQSNLAKTPPGGMGRLAPPHDPNQARSRKAQDVMIWGSVVVIIGSIVTLVIWLIAR